MTCFQYFSLKYSRPSTSKSTISENIFLDIFLSKSKYNSIHYVENGGWHFVNIKTPKEIEKKLKFKVINLNIGDVIIFSNTCPHRSKKNNSNVDRKILYYTYTPLKYGSMYEKYFIDKSKSKNTNSRSLSGEL